MSDPDARPLAPPNPERQAEADRDFEDRGGDPDQYHRFDEAAERRRQDDPAPPPDATLPKGGLTREGPPLTEKGEERPERGHG